MNKRDFVLGGAAVALGASVRATGAQPASAKGLAFKRLPDLAAVPNPEQWSGYLGEAFVLTGEHGNASLRLDHVVETWRDPRTRQFMLSFRIVAGGPVPAALQTLSHANGQRLGIYLEPSASRSDVLTAHFNRLA